MNKTRIGIVLAAFSFALLTIFISTADAQECSCPSCGVKVCVPKAEKEKIKKTKWSVEEKDVCIPRFNWPWQKCCPPKCGRVRTVCVLKKESVECESCGYKWKFTTVEGRSSNGCKLKHGTRGCKTGGCRTGNCGAACNGDCVDGCEIGSECAKNEDPANAEPLAVAVENSVPVVSATSITTQTPISVRIESNRTARTQTAGQR